MVKNFRSKISLFRIWVRFNWLRLALLGIISILSACSQKDDEPNPGPPVMQTELGKAKSWITSGDQSRLLAEQTEVSIVKVKGNATITLDTTIIYQEIEGFDRIICVSHQQKIEYYAKNVVAQGSF